MVNIEESVSRNLDELGAQIHVWNAKWWADLEGKPIRRDTGTLLMLVVSELAEAMEGRRKSKPGAPLMDDKLPHREMAEVELADVLIRCLDAASSDQYNKNKESIHREVQHIIQFKGSDLYRTMLNMQEGTQLLYLTSAATRAMDTYAYTGEVFKSLCHVIASTIILAAIWDYDLFTATDEKNAFNLTRVDHSVEARKQDGGKKW